MNAPVSAPKEFSRLNEVAFRNYVDAELADTYRKSSNLIVPYGFNLGFVGSDGSEAVFEFEGGTLGISIDGVIVFSIATDASLTALTSAYQAADATLQSNITIEASTRASADGALATLITSLDAAYQSADTTLQANITSEASARASADTAIASDVTTLTATVGGHTGSISTNATAIADINGQLDLYYGVKLTGGDNEVSFELLSDGTPAGGTVKLTATNIILDGDTVITGTLTYDKLGQNEISEGVSDEIDTPTSVGSSWVDAAEIEVTTPDAYSLIYLPWSLYVAGDSDGSLMVGRLRRDGATTIYETNVAGNPPEFEQEFIEEGTITYRPTFNGQVSGFDTDEPGAAGTYTYTFQVQVPGAIGTNWEISNRRLFALLFKR